MARLNNVRLWWARVTQPDPTYHCWNVDVLVNKEQAQEFKKLLDDFWAGTGEKSKGRLPKPTVDEDRGGYVIKMRRNVKKANGEDNPAPKLVDASNTPMDCLVGNDSVGNVQFGFYMWSNKFGKGVGVDLKGVQVTELVPYAGRTSDDEDFDAVGETKVVDNKKKDEDDDFGDLL
jgi:hypothetical protein